MRSVFGMQGLHADGSKATGFKSMVTAQFTGVSLQKDDSAFIKYNETTGLYDDDSSKTTDFELHASEETELVIKILAMAGIVLKDPGLYQIGTAEDVKNVQQEKA